MKKIFILICYFVMTVGFTWAQSSIDDEVTLIQSAFGQEKRKVVEAFMDLPESVSPGFWTVYQAYEKERQIIARERIKLINEYLENFETLGDEEAESLAKRSLKNDLALSKLHQKYFKKFKNVTSAVDAAKFLQIDVYIHNTIRNALQQELPFISK